MDGDLGANNFSDVDLDAIIQVLSRSRSFTTLSLGICHIGPRGCTSLAVLLRNQASNLTTLDLNKNFIEDECAEILARSLANNTKLEGLWLNDNNESTTGGCTSILDLVCNSSNIAGIMQSNHTLNILNMPWDDERMKDLLVRALGADDAKA